MYIKNEDLETLKNIELYLFNINKDNMIIASADLKFIIDKDNIKDIQALELYFKLYDIIENLQNKKLETNKNNYRRIKEKRKINKNYARSSK